MEVIGAMSALRHCKPADSAITNEHSGISDASLPPRNSGASQPNDTVATNGRKPGITVETGKPQLIQLNNSAATLRTSSASISAFGDVVRTAASMSLRRFRLEGIPRVMS